MKLPQLLKKILAGKGVVVVVVVHGVDDGTRLRQNAAGGAELCGCSFGV